MIYENKYYFGWFKKVNYNRVSDDKGIPRQDEEWYDDFETYKQFKNTISKKAVKEYFKSIGNKRGIMLTLDHYTNIITGHNVFRTMADYEDGDFRFPADFTYYYSNYRIGIPYEYEKYLKAKGIGKEYEK